MPQFTDSADAFLFQQIRDLQNQVSALATQGTTMVDARGVRVVGSVFDPPAYGLRILDGDGDERVMVGAQADGISYGIAVFDDSSNVRCSLGLLPNGDYGAMVSDVLGNDQEILPTVSDYDNSGITVNSATISSYAGSPSVTVETGVSGDYLVTAGSYLGISGQTAEAYLFDNGVEVGSLFGMSGATISANVQSTRQASKWQGVTTPNASHTFTLRYSNSTGASPTATFAAIFLGVTPI